MAATEFEVVPETIDEAGIRDDCGDDSPVVLLDLPSVGVLGDGDVELAYSTESVNTGSDDAD